MPAELAEPHLLSLLTAMGLDVEYVRAEGNTLYFLDEADTEVPVLDMLGGYGSLIFGHNHPEIVAHAQELLAAQVPVHAQFSRRAEAHRTAEAFNQAIRRETGVEEPYYAVFGNSGAEAIEIAMKHAELARRTRLDAITAEIAAHLETARAAVAAGTAELHASTDARLTEYGVDCADPGSFHSVVTALTEANEAAVGRPPLFLALSRAFHGKLTGSVQLTHNPDFRLPFGALAAQARFVPLNDPDALSKVIEAERVPLFDVALVDGAVQVVRRDLPVFAAFVVEPIQGEGGVNPVSAEFAEAIQRECAALECPVVVDEIQSGMGRTGALLASSLIGLRGDYYALAKSLGGGLAKTSVTLFRESVYESAFELMHSSTFAKDAFSTSIAHKVIQMLEADDGRAYRTAAERGARLASKLEEVKAEFPGVVKDVRGKGLFLGFEFHDQAAAVQAVLGAELPPGSFGYLISGYLLIEHRIRVAPTASAVQTLRLEPSIHLTDAEIDRFVAALRDVCTILEERDGQAFRLLFNL
ncbi:class III aminotransferase [Streptomyces sp. NRRL B-1140]|nr:class III aminotransferase [Streptomyces sp. NRRL B-1140]